MNTHFNRAQAAVYHLVASIILTSVVIGLVIWLWYPLDFISATGVTKIFALVIVVDICLGPFLTLIVYDPNKVKLKKDLIIILIIQLIALAYGVSTLANARTVYVVFAVDRFELVQANDLLQKNLVNASEDQFKKLPWLGPKWIATTISDDPDERMQVSMDTMVGGADIAQLPKYYQDISTVTADIIKRSKALNELRVDSKELAALTSKYKNRTLGYLPLTARKRDLSTVVDRSTGEIIEIINIDPW